MEAFDVFLCHNSQDKAEVKKIGLQLKEKGIKPWLDEWNLRPGLSWQRELETRIDSIKTAAVFVGKSGIGPWQSMEIDSFLREFVRRGCPVIPVILQSCTQIPKLPLFLTGMTWVDFRSSTPDPMKHLLWGITGEFMGSDEKDERPPAQHPNSHKKNILPKNIEAAEAAVIKDVIAIQSQEVKFNYKYALNSLLTKASYDERSIAKGRNEAVENASKLMEILESFGVRGRVTDICYGPVITRYEFQPNPGVKYTKIISLSDDIALNLVRSHVRIETIPGKAAVGIEVPNKKAVNVYLREVIESPNFIASPSNLTFAVGKNALGECVVADIAKMPHLLIAGRTGSGKSVCINSLIVSLLCRSTPEEVKMLMIDPKIVELSVYNGLPHLLMPVVNDPKKSVEALIWAVEEMVRRYKLFADKGVRDIKGFNNLVRNNTEEKPLPQVVIIIDELADLMMVAPNDVEDSICRLAQMSRATGMHLVIATQRPSVNVITGLIKANIPSRIAFAVSSQVDSRTIIDMAGAEKLLGKGDMLFYPIGESKPIRVEGAFISDEEIKNICEYIKTLRGVEYSTEIIDRINDESQPVRDYQSEYDELLPSAARLVVQMEQASISLIQRRLRIGYNRAARIIDILEELGIIGRSEGAKPRQVLKTLHQLEEMGFVDDH